MLSVPTWPSESQICERWTYIWPKMARNGRLKVIYKGTFVSNQSLYLYFSKPIDKHCLMLRRKAWRIRYRVHFTYHLTFFCTSVLRLLVDLGGLKWIVVEVSNSLVTKWRIRLMAMITMLNKVRVVDIKFSLITAILENFEM